jgi:hypothetical protein
LRATEGFDRVRLDWQGREAGGNVKRPVDRRGGRVVVKQ